MKCLVCGFFRKYKKISRAVLSPNYSLVTSLQGGVLPITKTSDFLETPCFKVVLFCNVMLFFVQISKNVRMPPSLCDDLQDVRVYFFGFSFQKSCL